MVPVSREQNVEVLRQYTTWLESEVKNLHQEVARLKGASEQTKQEWLDAKLRDQLSVLRQKFFGVGREELTPRADRPVGHEQEQLKLHGEYPQEGKVTPAEGFKPEGPVFFTYKMSERELAAESATRGIKDAGASAWEEVAGLYQAASEITVFERVYQEVLHRQCKYRLKKKFNDSGKEVLITAPGPTKLRAGSRYSIDFAVAVVSDKYEYHSPLERQRRKMEAQGLEVDTKTLYGLCEAVAEHCAGVLPRIRREIMNDFCAVHLDESPWPILGQATNGYMWAMSNRSGAYFQFEPTRSGKIAAELTRDFRGAVLTDGFSGYTRIKGGEKIRVGHCWSHARREFFDRIKDFPAAATDGVRIIDELFRVEAQAKSFAELRELRKTQSREITDRFRAWMIKTSTKYLPESGINRAISYCLKFWAELTRFLGDLSLPLSNNDAERALRHVVMGRKNFAGSKTINGADTAASIYTVIETCKRVGLQPSQYLKYLIDARWFNDPVKTPLEYSLEKLGPNKKVTFPAKADWAV